LPDSSSVDRVADMNFVGMVGVDSSCVGSITIGDGETEGEAGTGASITSDQVSQIQCRRQARSQVRDQGVNPAPLQGQSGHSHPG